MCKTGVKKRSLLYFDAWLIKILRATGNYKMLTQPLNRHNEPICKYKVMMK